jgi:hypothetical protein
MKQETFPTFGKTGLHQKSAGNPITRQRERPLSLWRGNSSSFGGRFIPAALLLAVILSANTLRAQGEKLDGGGVNHYKSIAYSESRAQADTLKPVLALKTNLLYDLALSPNIELEIPIGNRWSISAGFMRGWWLKKDWSFCWQIEAADLEGRYWPGCRTDKPLLNGWFAGAFAGGGFYDFQLNSDHGTQGEFYIMAGLSAGYVHRIGQNLNLEYELGAGFFTMDYRKYRVAEYYRNDVLQRDLIRQGPEKRYKALIPLKVKVALSWTIPLKPQKKGDPE